MNDYYRLNFTVEPASADVCDLLADALADAGFESFEPADDGASMVAYIPAAKYAGADIAAAASGLPIPAAITWTEEFVEGRDWNSEWERNYFKPIVVAGRVAVYSSFHTDIPEAEHHIVIDPRMAFGTGHHATTTLMMQALLDADLTGRSLIDMGTGTGILAILGAKLGASPVTAIEIDPFAAENAVDNVALNRPSDNPVTVICGDAAALVPYAGSADFFLANINRNIITADINLYAAAMKHGAQLTVSGFYVADRPVVEAAAAAAGFVLRSVAEIDGWSSMTFVRQ